MCERYTIRIVVITLAAWLIQACTMLPVTDSQEVVQVESKGSCECQSIEYAKEYTTDAKIKEILEFATEAEIKEIQARLILLGYPAGNIDGVVGNNTRNAIKAYQADHKLLTDGRPSTELLVHIKAIVGNGQTPTIGFPGL